MMELGATLCQRHSPLFDLPRIGVLHQWTSGRCGKFSELTEEEKEKRSILRYWIESNGKLLLYADWNAKNKLSGIHELPVKLPNCIQYEEKDLEPFDIRKRTIGNVDYEEKIIRVSNYEKKRKELDDGYLWADSDKMKKITLSGPHRKWIEEIFSEKRMNWDEAWLLVHNGSPTA